MLRETSVLRLRLAGRGREGGDFVTVVIEGEDESMMKGRVRCLECDWGRVVGEVEYEALLGVFIRNPGYLCPNRGERTGQTYFCMATFSGRAGGQRAPHHHAHGLTWQ